MPQPSLEEARANLWATSVTKNGELLPITASSEEIGAATGGVGVQLYFLFLKYTGCAFAVWSLFHLPVLFIYIQSSGGPDASGLELASAFNVGIAKSGLVTDDTEYNIPGIGIFYFGEIIPFLGILDAAGQLAWIIIVGWFCYRTMPDIVQKFDDMNVTPSDFSVEISGLPSRIDDHESYEQKLRDHIITIVQRARAESGKEPVENANEIVFECCLVRDYKGQLLAFSTLEQLQTKLDNLGEKEQTPKVEAKIKKIEDKMEKLREKSRAPMMGPEERDVCKRAYVMLMDCDTKELLLDYYRFANFRLFRACQKQYLRFEGKTLKVVEAPEPGNIMWENQDRNELKVFLRKLLTFVLTAIMFAISFAIIFAAKAATKRLQEDLQQCVPQETPLTIATWQSALPTLDMCECQELGIATVVSVPELKDIHCKKWLESDILFKGLMGAGALIVVIVNLVLQVAVRWFTRMEQPLSVSSFYASLAFKIAIAQFFNTGIIVLLVNSNMFSFIPLIGKSGYEDFERQWYQRVGGALVITMLIQALSPHSVQVCMYPILRCVRRVQAASKQTQRDLNKLYTWPDFDLAVRLAGLFNVIFCTMLYSAGLPILSMTATVTFFMVFLCDKFLLLRASRMPPAYNQSLLMVFKRIVPFACLLHTSFAIYMLGNPDMFPGAALVDELDPTSPNYQLDQVSGFFDIPIVGKFFLRCLAGASFGNFLLWLLIVAFFALNFVRSILGATFGVFLQACCAICCRRSVEEDKHLAQNKVTAAVSRKSSRDSKSAAIFGYSPDQNPKYAGLIAQANVGSPRRSASPTKSVAVTVDDEINHNISEPTVVATPLKE